MAQSAGFVRSGAEGGSRATETKQRLRIRERRRQAKRRETKNTPKEVFLFCDKGSRRSFFEKREQSCDVAQSAGFVRSGAEGGTKATETKINGSAYAKENVGKQRRETKNTPKEVFLFCD